MEEILSSIKRIIAEDSEATLSVPRAKRSVASASSTDPADAPEAVLELTDAVAPDDAETASPEVIMEMPRKSPTADAQAASLLSSSALEASRTSLAALSALVIKPEITGSDTLEGMVREMLRPMIAEWLDSRLPDIVDRLVAQEIARITRS